MNHKMLLARIDSETIVLPALVGEMLTPIFSQSFPAEVFSGSISQSHESWAIGTLTGYTTLYSSSTPEGVMLRYCSGSVRALEFSEANDSFLSGDSSGTVFLIDVRTQAPSFARQKGHSDSIECMQFLDSSTFVAGDTGGHIRVWDIRSNNPVQTYFPEDDYVSDLAVVDSKNFISSHGNGVATVLTLSSVKRKQYYKQEDDDFTSMTFSPATLNVIIGSSRPKTYTVKYPSLDFVCEGSANTKSPIVSLRLMKGTENRVVIVQEDGCVCINDIAPNHAIFAYRSHDGTRGAALGGLRLMTWGSDKVAKIWDLEELAQREFVPGGRKKHTQGKKKKKPLKIMDVEDDFFKNFS
jgi:WD40 repeat protein